MLPVLLNLLLVFFPVGPGTATDKEMPLIKKVYFGTELYCLYSYTDSKLISEEKTKHSYIHHLYNEKKQLVSTEYYEDLYPLMSNARVSDSLRIRKEWVYPGNTLKTNTMTFEYDSTGVLLRSADRTVHMTYDYDAKGRISRQTSYHGRKAYGYTDFRYDRQGNLVKTSRYEFMDSGTARLITTNECQFDTHPNPYYSFRSLLIPGKNTNPNNITKEVYTLHFMVDHPVRDQQVTEYHYEYNEDGYPVKVNNEMIYMYK